MKKTTLTRQQIDRLTHALRVAREVFDGHVERFEENEEASPCAHDLVELFNGYAADCNDLMDILEDADTVVIGGGE